MSENLVRSEQLLEELLGLLTHTNIESQSRPIHSAYHVSPGGERRHHIFGRGVVLVDGFTADGPKGGRRLGGRRLALLRNGGLVEQDRVGQETAAQGTYWTAGGWEGEGSSRVLSAEAAARSWDMRDIAGGILAVLSAAADHHRRTLHQLERAAARAEAIAGAGGAAAG